MVSVVLSINHFTETAAAAVNTLQTGAKQLTLNFSDQTTKTTTNTKTRWDGKWPTQI